MAASRSSLLILIASLGASCTSTHELATINADKAVVQRLDPDCAWRVLDGGTLRGYVVRFVDPAIATRCSYSVRNELQQDLGTIDELGRAWRFVPHQREAQWICTSTLTRGAAELLGASPQANLEEVSLELLRIAPEPR
ncbi:MAG: hypothetical protein ABI054_10430 [Planctomycetota bacterium]